ncbi:MAG: RNase H-like domain-containing protein, partial [Tannerellaceae bacterium]
MLRGINGAVTYLDDIIIKGNSLEDLQQLLESVFNRMAEFGFTFRVDKCNFYMNSIKYLGFIIDQHGRRPDPDNIQAIQRMPAPTDITTLRSFLGLVSHYGAYLPALHRLRGPLNSLLIKDTVWHWSEECEVAFNKVKEILKSDLLLTHYNPALKLIVTTDASQYGIGAVIAHIFPDGSEKAIIHAARSLSSAEKKYSQIEKEALAVVFAVKKFHKMLYGRRFTLITDHKPLLAIFGSKKGIPVCTANRLQRWATTLLGYDFTIKYNSTTSIGQADALSRLIGSQPDQTEDSVVAAAVFEAEVNSVVAMMINSLPVTAEMIADATERNNTMKDVMRCLQKGWPSSISGSELQQYYQRRDALSVV